MRVQLDHQLQSLYRDLVLMGSLCETMLAKAAHALPTGYTSFALTMTQQAKQMKEKEEDIEQRCMRLILSQQPVASDLKQIHEAQSMARNIRRMADHALDIVEIMASSHLKTNDLEDMALSTIYMVSHCIDAFVNQDIPLARSVVNYDDIVDACFVKIKESMVQRLQKQTIDSEDALDIFMIAKYFERIGDHASHMAQDLIDTKREERA